MCLRILGLQRVRVFVECSLLNSGDKDIQVTEETGWRGLGSYEYVVDRGYEIAGQTHIERSHVDAVAKDLRRYNGWSRRGTERLGI
jgi:hypothetical protein